ncbi:FG-GAP-like repeat-containing protein [Gemmata sp.]|uniref:FG-GAP-like repeat-containing protein n=1 Tax=Gemmata sp. TaxID=1914242 RepID=UPI003F728645
MSLEERVTPAATLSVADATFALNAGAAGVVVTRTGDLTQQVTVGYTVTGGTAAAGTNYQATPASGTLFFPAGSAAERIPVSVLPTNFAEDSRDFSVSLTGVIDSFGPPAAYAPGQSVGAGKGADAVAVADVNGDGKLDLIVANSITNGVSVLLNTTAPGAAALTFAPRRVFAVGAGPAAVAVADVNGDGRPDIVTANTGSNTVSVLLNTTAPGALTPAFARHAAFATGAAPVAVAAADVNGDGRVDVVVANRGSNSVSVLLNTTRPGAARPAFGRQTALATGAVPVAVAVGDVTGDGRADVVVANRGSNSVSVLVNATAPGAAAPAFAAQKASPAGMAPVAVALADLNGDGALDVAVANRGSGTVSVLLNRPASGKSKVEFAARRAFATGAQPSSVAAADVNGDGRPDLLVANLGSGTASVLVNATAPGAGTPAFSGHQPARAGTAPSGVAAADFNGDGKLDLVAANSTANTASVLINATPHPGAADGGVPAFNAAATFPTRVEPSSLLSLDVNGDGKPDLIVTNKGSNTVSVLMNTTAPGAAVPTFAPQRTFATGLQPFAVAAADVNGDGRLDLVVANVASNSVTVLLNTTPVGAAVPTFAPQQAFPVGLGPEAVLAPDVNGDGRPDLVVANNGEGTLSVLINTTAPGAAGVSYTPHRTFATGTHPASLAWADVNGDGRGDVVAANMSSNTVSVLLNSTPRGSTLPVLGPQRTFATGVNPAWVSAADVTGDGRPDLLVANRGSNTVSVLVNTSAPGGAPGFAPHQVFATGSNPVAVSALDVNGDGKLDLVVPNYGSNNVSVLLNTTAAGGGPSFAAQEPFAAGANPVAVSILDVNGDGRRDVVVANRGANTVSVLMNAAAAVASAPATVTLTGAPVVTSITRVDPELTKAPTVAYTVTFSKPVTGVTAENFALAGAGAAGATVGTPTTTDGGVTWTVTVTTGADGPLGLNLSSRGGIRDGSGNQLYRTTSDSGTAFSPVVGPSYTIDRTGPAVSIVPGVAAIGRGPLTFTVTYTDPHFSASTLTAAGVKLVATGTATGTIVVAPGSGATRTVTITDIKGDGALRIALVANTAADVLGNLAGAAVSAAVTVDNTPPTVTIAAPEGPVAAGGTLVFTVTYADPNFAGSTLTAAEVTLNADGTATGTVTVTGTGATRLVTVSGITGTGCLGISLAAGTANDAAGNLAPAAGPSAMVRVAASGNDGPLDPDREGNETPFPLP